MSMPLDEAKLLHDILGQAIAAAESVGSDEVQMQSHLQTLDDEARAELEQAIAAAKQKKSES